jgi:DUF2950 family protein
MSAKSKIRSGGSLRSKLAVVFAVLATLFFAAWFAPESLAQQKQQTFPSPEQASQALYAAAQQEQDAALLDVLGQAGQQVVSSGDPIEDLNERTKFVAKYEEMHRLTKGPGGMRVLYVGAENWPFPIPLVEKNGRWYFDTDAGKDEILLRRIGKNELTAIDACHQLVDAEKQYYMKEFHGEHQYAQRFISDKGRHNGLFWSETADTLESPLDPLVASAGEEAPADGEGAGSAQGPMPYNGYYFRILTRQGKNAPGGGKSFTTDGKLLNGFAFVAYPVEYRSSGVMTFIVNDSGAVYEKDLGPNTATLAKAMTEYNPDSSWHRAD